MLNGVAARIDGFLEGINTGLDVLGIEKRVPLIGTIELGGIENPFEVIILGPKRLVSQHMCGTPKISKLDSVT